MFLLLLPTCLSAPAAGTQTFAAKAAEHTGGALIVTDPSASGGSLVGLSKTGEGVSFTHLPPATRLAIRYASMEVGTISVSVNGQPARKMNIHSSGALTPSFLNAIIDAAIPAGATLTISMAAGDVPVNVDRIIVGSGTLGLPPDIWNLPPLPVTAGPYAPDWKAMSRIYTAPEWWRDAKFGAWSHWDPQSMPEQGDWYSRGIYLEDSKQYNYHLSHFGPPSNYGYKDIAQN